MKYIIYTRVSTNAQEFMQQRNTIDSYISSHGLDTSNLYTIEEKEHGDTPIEQKEISRVLTEGERGDILIVSEISRIQRTTVELLIFTRQMFEKGIGLIEARSGQVFVGDPENFVNKIYLFVLGISAEMELYGIRQRSQAALDAVKKSISQQGYYITKRGRVITKLGNSRIGSLAYTGAMASAMALAERRKCDEGLQRAKRIAEQMRNSTKPDGKKYTLAEIADELNALKIFSENRKYWAPYSIHRLLKK